MKKPQRQPPPGSDAEPIWPASEVTRDQEPGTQAREIVVPVVAEQIKVGKRERETGRVRVSKVVREEEQTVDLPLLREDVVVERVPVNEFVDRAPAARREGEVLVLPVIEQVLVLEKRLMLVEEIRVSRRISQFHRPQQVTVRREEARIERLRPEPPAPNAAEPQTASSDRESPILNRKKDRTAIPKRP